MSENSKKFLGAAELLESRRMVSIGNKKRKTTTKEKQVINDYHAYFSNLSQIPAKLPKNLGHVEWHDDRNLGLMVSTKNRPSGIGFSEKKDVYLYPEEILFLFENNSIDVSYNGLRLSLQDLYSLLFKNSLTHDFYQVYAHLSRLGYRLKRHQKIDKTTKATTSSVETQSSVPADIKPLIDPNEPHCSEKIFSILSSISPRYQETPIDQHFESKFEIIFDVYAIRSQQIPNKPDFYLILADESSQLSILDIEYFRSYLQDDSEVVFVVKSQFEFIFHRYNLFDCWCEFPIRWKNNIEL